LVFLDISFVMELGARTGQTDTRADAQNV